MLVTDVGDRCWCQKHFRVETYTLQLIAWPFLRNNIILSEFHDKNDHFHKITLRILVEILEKNSQEKRSDQNHFFGSEIA